MDIYEAIQQRHSVRAYKSDPIPGAVLQRVLDAMRLAPSACNNQPWMFIVIKDADVRARLVPACRGQKFIGDAPVVIAACGWEERAYPRMGGWWNSLAVDIAIALDHLMLACAAEGLGTCWIGAFDEGQVKQILGVPDDVRVIALTPIGFPADGITHTKRKPLSEITCCDRWEPPHHVTTSACL